MRWLSLSLFLRPLPATAAAAAIAVVVAAAFAAAADLNPFFASVYNSLSLAGLRLREFAL